ncbi:alpha/beta fold hydrolase BchO [Altererythrobacter lutimaris]|uniref:Alpha/beta fold hydrolase n=1 Tax=Altererythrobacter lutimaris TaxID=2743979 RepID=A0A850HBR7_9SPHN|nr:alpha/beta fold hydrolase BchO [Altererythrobacter lutimaris]NVE94990.1 alpha/beta fold hydrolase [Altererythrobacter lutimaris]
MSRPLHWEREGRNWPHREASRFVEVSGLRWHIQQMGSAKSDYPKLLLLHGTGASVHSWHGLMPLLAERFEVFAPDLPGHAFTAGKPRGGLTLAGIVSALSDLLEQERFEPDMVVGHSAGAAIALEWALRHSGDIPLVGLNPAIMPFRGPAAQVFPAMAKLLLVNPFAPRIFARMAQVPGEAARFLQRATGSRTDPVSEACYATLFGNHRHARGALEMMANWDLDALKTRLSKVTNPTLLIHSSKDKAIPLASVEAAQRLLPDARLELINGAGHLAHEQQPGTIAALIAGFAAELGILAPEDAQATP